MNQALSGQLLIPGLAAQLTTARHADEQLRALMKHTWPRRMDYVRESMLGYCRSRLADALYASERLEQDDGLQLTMTMPGNASWELERVSGVYSVRVATPSLDDYETMSLRSSVR